MEKLILKEQNQFTFMILPGNWCAPIEEANWYTWLSK